MARLAKGLTPLTNVRLRLAYRDPARESEDIYGKVLGDESADDRSLTRIHFTSLTDSDAQTIAALLTTRGQALTS